MERSVGSRSLSSAPTAPERTAGTWAGLRSRILASTIAAEPGSVRIRHFSGEPLAAVYHFPSGQTSILNESAARTLDDIARGGCRPISRLAGQYPAQSLDAFLQTVISLKDKGLATLIPPDDITTADDGATADDRAGPADSW